VLVPLLAFMSMRDRGCARRARRVDNRYGRARMDGLRQSGTRTTGASSVSLSSAAAGSERISQVSPPFSISASGRSISFCVRSSSARPELVATIAAPDYHPRRYGACDARRRAGACRKASAGRVPLEVYLAPARRLKRAAEGQQDVAEVSTARSCCRSNASDASRGPPLPDSLDRCSDLSGYLRVNRSAVATR
jgi:hypothetical protein